MREDTRAVLQDALAAHVAARAETIAAGQHPEFTDRAAVTAAANAHLEATPPKDVLEAAYITLRDDPDADPAAVSEAAHELASRVQAERVVYGLPIETGAQVRTT